MTFYRKLIALILLAATSISLLACGGKASEEYIYTAEKLDIPLEEGYQLRDSRTNIIFALKDGGIGVITEGRESVDPGTASEIYGYDASALQKDEFSFGFTKLLSYSGTSLSSTVKLYSALGISEAEGAPDGGYVYLMANGTGGLTYEILRCDKDGNALSPGTSGYSFSENPDITVSDDGTVFALTRNNLIAVFPEDGGSFSIDFPKDMKRSGTKDYKLWRGNDGDIIFTYKAVDPDGNISYFSRKIDAGNKCLDDAAQLPSFNGTPVYNPMPGHDMLYRTSVGLFAVDVVDGKTIPTQLLTWSDVGFVSGTVCDIIPVSGEMIYISVRDDTDPDTTGVYLLRRVPLLVSDGITYLSIAYDSGTASGELRQLSEYAAEFNRTHDDVRVRFKPYTDAGLSAAELIAKDISAGKVPDIILFSETMPYPTFSGFGMFCDLYEKMDGGTLTRDDLVPAVREPFEEDGELFALPLGFDLKLLVPTGNEDIPESDADSLAALIRAHSGSLTALDTDTEDVTAADLKLAFLNDLLPGLLREYIDDGTCDLTGISGLLDAMNGADIVTKSQTRVSDFKDGKILFDSVTIDGAAGFMAEKYSIMNGGKVRSAYPDAGVISVPHMTLAIPEKSAASDGAWDFIEFCVSSQTEKLGNTDTQKDMQMLSGFPYTEEGLVALFGTLDRFYIQLTIRTRTDPLTGETYEQPSANYSHRATFDSAMSGSPETEFPDMLLLTVSDDDIEDLRSLIAAAGVSSVCDSAVSSIILEEASAYFSGARSVEDAVRFMTDRVNTRLQETK